LNVTGGGIWGNNTGNADAANAKAKPETKEDKKKAKMANALFSGIADHGDSSDDSSDDEKKKKKKKKDKKNKEESSTAPVQDEGSLIDTGSSNTAATTAPATQSNDVMDLLDFGDSNS